MRSRIGLPATLSAATLAGLLIASLWLHAQLNDTRSLPSLFPSGALLYLEANDFHSLLTQWNSSVEKKKWLASDNFGVLSQSRLVQRLAQAQTGFASVANLPIEMNLADQVAGTRSAFVFYNLADLTFVYVTRLDSSRLEGNALWNKRDTFRSREVAGIPFYEKSEGDPLRTVAFASYQGWFVVSTDETRMAQTLALLGKQQSASLATEAWFRDTVKEKAKTGDLRLVYNLAVLLKTPQFRTYWIQRNATELKPFVSGITDLWERDYGFEEQRALLRLAPLPAPVANPAVAEALRYVPQDHSLYRAWLAPGRATLGSVLQQVVLSEPTEMQDYGRYAPQVNAEAGLVGNASDLETRIDEPPFERAKQQSIQSVVNAILSMQPLALLHVQTTTLLDDQVFVLPASEAVIVCKAADRAALETAIATSAGLIKTGSLDPLRLAVADNVIHLSRLPARPALAAVQAAADATYAAGYNNVREWPHYQRLFALIGHAVVSPEALPPSSTPAFFSGNVRSLGDTLSRLQRATIVTQDQGAVIRDTVRYELTAP